MQDECRFSTSPRTTLNAGSALNAGRARPSGYPQRADPSWDKPDRRDHSDAMWYGWSSASTPPARRSTRNCVFATPAPCSTGPSTAAATIEHSPCDRVRVGDLVSRRQAAAAAHAVSTTNCAAFGRRAAVSAIRAAAVPAAAVDRYAARPRRRARAGASSDLDDPVKARGDSRRKVQVERHPPGAAVGRRARRRRAVPRFKHGDHLFSFSYGERPALVLHRPRCGWTR